jgi:polynucleotide 5'-kinase involved in rRNA processing
MDEKWSNTLKTLSEFKNILMKHKMQYVIVLMGAEKAGKTTLANYIAGSDLFS